MGSNVRSNFWLTNMVCGAMAERIGSSIIIVSSIGGMLGSGMLGVYSLSKAADYADSAQYRGKDRAEKCARQLHRA